MSLRTRLLLATLILSLATAVVLAFGVRLAFQRAEEERFARESRLVSDELERALREDRTALTNLLTPLCAHDPLVDSALLGLTGGELDERLLSIRLRLAEEKQALGLDTLSLVTDRGELLAGEPIDATSRSALATGDARDWLIAKPLAFAASCKKVRGRTAVGLIATREVARRLAEFGQGRGLGVAVLDAANEGKGQLTRSTISESLGGVRVALTRSREPLLKALERLDETVLGLSALSLTLAATLSWLLSRGLARPVALFAERTRGVLKDGAHHLPVTGGPELEEAAIAFNQTLDELALLKERLAQSERSAARRDVAREVAHEIKNPLTPIRSSIETLRRLRARGASEFDEYFDEATSTVLSEVARMSELVRSFATYASLPEALPVWLDLEAEIAKVAHLHEGLGIPVVVLLPDQPLPKVLFDQNQFTQILTNLVKNALEALAQMPDPLVQIALARDTDAEGTSRLIITVLDNGPGVPPEIVDSLFRPHVTTKATGSGLGLTLSRRLAAEQGGDLRYEASPGGGAKFVLSLRV